MAEDPGFLLVQAGLVRDDQVLNAREAQAQVGGTLGEHLVLAGFVDDDDLTSFYASKLVIPRVAAEDLARIPVAVLRRVPADMAAEFRVVPVAADGERNVTLAMSDPADRHVVDEVAFFTGCYVVRAVATQLQIAWCLAHYYGVMTPLARARLVGAGEAPGDDALSAEDAAAALRAEAGKQPGTPCEVEEEEETGPARMPFLRKKPVRRRTSELAPRSGMVDVPDPPREPDRLPAVVVEDEELTGEAESLRPDEAALDRRSPSNPAVLDQPAIGSGEILLLDRVKRPSIPPRSQTDPLVGHVGPVDSRGNASQDKEETHGTSAVGNEGENVKVRRQSKADRRGRRRRTNSSTDPGQATTDPIRSIPANQTETPPTPAMPDASNEADSPAASTHAAGLHAGGRHDEDEVVTDPGEAATNPMRLGAHDSGSNRRRHSNVDEGWDVDDGWGPPGTTIPAAYLGAVPSSYDDDESGKLAPLQAGALTADPAAALAADAAVVAAASAAAAAALAALPTSLAAGRPASAPASVATEPQAPVDPAELAAELERSSNRLLETLRALERAPGRDEVVDVLLDHLGTWLRRRAFFAVKSGVLFAFRQYGAARPGVGTAELSLDRPSTFGQVTMNRMPYRGTLSPAAVEFVERALGSAGKGEAVVVPVLVRGRTVGLLYGDGLTARLFDEHQMVLGRAAGQALERILTNRSAKA